jgi:hypothetical protein
MKYRTVEWQVKDREMLEIIKRITGVSREIETCKRKHGDYFRLRLQGQYWVDAFTAAGINPNKTFTCQVPDIPDELFFHFLRGVIDGDGNITVRGGGKSNRDEYKRLTVSIASGSILFLSGIHRKVGGIIEECKTPGHAVLKLVFDCSSAVELLKKVYEDSEGLRLSRKYDQWMQFLSSGQKYRNAA